MEHYRKRNELFLRLEPGEKLVESLVTVATSERMDFALIVSGVGMIDGAEMGFFCVNKNDYDIYRVTDIYDLSSISGNIALFNGTPRPHVHIVANKPDYATLSGHLIECKAHITIEIGLQIFENTGLHRTTEKGRPATFITRK